ncbi:DNA methyltransferase [Acidiphilium sp.]|uniref:DNA methyltransferase n=1 Tax=Acidiphilium sp. TaxID=527 RepID=UPI00258C3877|nr:DNA methyltransferase [Acidiphilium sp.]
MLKRESTKSGGKAARSSNGLEALYERALPATRTGALYGAFPYPTKISPEAAALFIAAHTKPGDTVFDGFAGSGTTGLAALLCENPSPELQAEAKRLGLNVEWGARNAVLYELGALGAFVGKTMTNPPDPKAFRKAAEQILKDAERDLAWMYQAEDADGSKGSIRYLIWSDVLRCPSCRREATLWDACVSRAPAEIASTFTCPSCGHVAARDQIGRPTETKCDDVLGKPVESRKREPVWVYGTSGTKTWSRPTTEEDRDLLERIATTPVPDSVPRVEIPWGDLYRSGYHQGITHLHQFYTRRNLIIFGRLWEYAERYTGSLRDALRFWLLSYNASHATIMTRVVAKSGQKDLIITSAQPGVLYVSGLPVEKNLIIGLRRKLKTIDAAFGTIRGRKGRVTVHQKSSCAVGLADGSIDYVFTDPPFGGNIPYAEINFINEAWLGRYTDRTEEAIVSVDQEKSLVEYQELLTDALGEVHRILKPTGKATVVFHSASADVWNALQAAYTDGGLSVECAGVLGKTQGSFKQVTTTGAVRGDPVLLLSRSEARTKTASPDVWKVAAQLRLEASKVPDPDEQTVQRLYSRLVTHYLTLHQQVPLDAESFYRWYAGQPPAETFASAGD